MRSYVVYVAGFLVVFLPFLGFVAGGWPGEPNSCLYEEAADGTKIVKPRGCFCEWVEESDVLEHRKGVRQPASTWSNLYALVTAFVVAFGLARDRKRTTAGATPDNLIKSSSFIADWYVFAVMFLGLGSMWFHASITQWGGRFDGASMYFFAGYMVWYTVHRNWPSTVVFWVGYLATVAAFTAMHNWAPSELLIGILVLAYLAFEVVILCRKKAHFHQWGFALTWWILALVSFGIAFIFWIGGQEGNFMCKTEAAARSAFQPHGLWHLFAGIMAVFLYYYWRRERAPADD